MEDSVVEHDELRASQSQDEVDVDHAVPLRRFDYLLSLFGKLFQGQVEVGLSVAQVVYFVKYRFN